MFLGTMHQDTLHGFQKKPVETIAFQAKPNGSTLAGRERQPLTTGGMTEILDMLLMAHEKQLRLASIPQINSASLTCWGMLANGLQMTGMKVIGVHQKTDAVGNLNATTCG
jgi:hypothetical protein